MNHRSTFASASVFTMCSVAPGAITTLTFEGLGNGQGIGGYYAGGAGGDFGISFSANARSAIDSDAGGSGNFANEPSGSTAAYWSNGASSISIDVANGFTSFSGYYTTISFTGSWAIYSGAGATGSIVASGTFNALGSSSGDPNGEFSNWELFGANGDGSWIGRSIVLSGTSNEIGFDDLSFDIVPAPGALALLALAGGARRRRR